MLLKAPAKINLTLKILSKRANGYHDISSLMQAICLFDEVEVSVDAQGHYIRVSADTPGVPDGAANLAYRAAELAAAEFLCGGNISDAPPVGIKISLVKNIPVAAGLAGGSANAAAVLLALAKEFSPDTDISEIAAIGAGLGADIPFCVYACAAANPRLGYEGAARAWTGGIGDHIAPAAAPARVPVLLVKPGIEVSTAKAYAMYDESDVPASQAGQGGNDLEALCAAGYPVVAELLAELRRMCAEEGAAGARVQLSGSGPTVFVYFEGGCETAALRVHARALESFSGMFVCLTETMF